MFAQIIRFRTKKWDALAALNKDWEASEIGRTVGPRQAFLLRDREDPERGRMIVFFESYEKAMENSNRPETHEWSLRFSRLTEGAPEFENLDMVHELRGGTGPR